MTTTQNPPALPAAPDIDLGGGYTQPPLPPFQGPAHPHFVPVCATGGCTWHADEAARWDATHLYDTPEEALDAEWSLVDGGWYCPHDTAKRICAATGHDWADWPELPNLICARCTAHRPRPAVNA